MKMTILSPMKMAILWWASLLLCASAAFGQTNRPVASLPTNTAPAKLLAVTSAGASVQVPLATIYTTATNAATTATAGLASLTDATNAATTATAGLASLTDATNAAATATAGLASLTDATNAAATATANLASLTDATNAALTQVGYATNGLSNFNPATSNSYSGVFWQIGTNYPHMFQLGLNASRDWILDPANIGHPVTSIGYGAGQSATNSDGALFLGAEAGYRAYRSHFSTMVGTFAGHDATNAYNSTFLGYGAGEKATNAYGSTLVGANAGRYNGQQDMTTVVGSGIHGGWAVGPVESTNSDSFYYSTRELNSSFGYGAGSVIQGDRNTMLGAYAGTGEWGDWSGSSTNDSLSTYVGFAAGRAWGAPTLTNAIAIGARAKATNSNQTVIGNTSSTEVRFPMASDSILIARQGESLAAGVDLYAWTPTVWAQSNANLTLGWNNTILNAPLLTAGPWFEQQSLIRGWFSASGGLVVRNGYAAAADAAVGTIYAQSGFTSAGGSNYFAGPLAVYQNSPTSDQNLFRVSTSDDVSRFSVDEDGDLSMDGSVTSAGDLYVGATKQIGWTGRNSFYSPASGVIAIETGTPGVGISILTSGGASTAALQWQTTNWPAFKFGGTNASVSGNPLLIIQGGTNSAKVVDVIVTGNITPTNGLVLIDCSTFPTSSIPAGSSTLTNTLDLVYKGARICVATNYAAGGWQKWNFGTEAWAAFTP